MDRRSFIRAGVAGTVVAAAATVTSPLEALAAPAVVGPGPFGPLGSANADGIQLPAGFTSRLIATSGRRVGSTGYTWHYAPDGGACFPSTGGGWVYVSNAELSSGGGVGALKFNSSGTVTSAYRILSDTSRNCAGGPTPWGTWLSCEETSSGRVWECNPQAAGNGTVVTSSREARLAASLDGPTFSYLPTSDPTASSGSGRITLRSPRSTTITRSACQRARASAGIESCPFDDTFITWLANEGTRWKWR